MNYEGLDMSILLPAFCAGIIVLLTHVPLGQEVLKRGIIFIDLAIAQIAGLGVITAHFFDLAEYGNWAIQATAILSALLGAFLLGQIEKKWGAYQESVIGITFVLAATASILMLAGNPHGGEHLKDLLVGQILWVTWEQLLPVCFLSIFVILIWINFKKHIGGQGFYILFALAITASVQLVGVYLVFSSLIIPALGSIHFSGRNKLIFGYIIGLLGYLSGLVFSALFDLPSGAVIVWSIAIIAILLNIMVNFYKLRRSKIYFAIHNK
nr:metal ABC transporter permease [sulfur-oxidizing endosymbiont of Gigantopelta aegis]